MSNLSDFIGGSGKPKQITRITSGSGTYVPTSDMARCFVRVQSGGAAGGTGASGFGGGAGAMAEGWLRIPITGYPYVVGAPATSGQDGNVSRLGPISPEAGKCASPSATRGNGGSLGASVLKGSTLGSDVYLKTGGLSGVSGGSGGIGGSGVQNSSSAGYTVGVSGSIVPGQAATASNAGPGGDSFFGIGGAAVTGSVGGNATGYGAGGGGCTAGGTGGTGAGGMVEIWDYGV